jgi:DNA replication licensing factor MCM2
VHVRILSMPLVDRLRDLRQRDLNSLVKVCGVVTRRTGVCPQLRKVAFNCSDCNNQLLPVSVGGASSPDLVRPRQCPSCGASSLVQDQHRSVYGNYQRLTLQESPGSVEAGRVPRTKDVVVLGDLIDAVKPGEEVEVTGIYSQAGGNVNSSDRSGFPVLGTVIEANHLQKKNSATNSGITDEDKRRIRELAADPRVS